MLEDANHKDDKDHYEAYNDKKTKLAEKAPVKSLEPAKPAAFTKPKESVKPLE